jgi:hypothetical protein
MGFQEDGRRRYIYVSDVPKVVKGSGVFARLEIG